MARNYVSVKKVILKNTLRYNGEELLKYRIEYPEFASSFAVPCLSHINSQYRDRALEYRHYCETELFAMAVEQYKGDIENGFPVRVFEAVAKFETTYLDTCVISLYTDRYEFTGGAHGNTLRDSQTWNLKTCTLMELTQLVLCPPCHNVYILTEIERQIKLSPGIYFENYEELIIQYFNQNNFYCSPKGITVYYQQYEIAPYSSGIREFLLPYTDCVIDPQMLCPAT